MPRGTKATPPGLSSRDEVDGATPGDQPKVGVPSPAHASAEAPGRIRHAPRGPSLAFTAPASTSIAPAVAAETPDHASTGRSTFGSLRALGMESSVVRDAEIASSRLS